MMVVLVIGLPASGKTTWAKAQIAQLLAQGVDARLLDDPRTREEFEAGLVAGGKVLFIADPQLCAPGLPERVADQIREKGHEVTFVYFANDPERCHVNAARRPDKAVSRFIIQLARRYQLPAGVAGLPVYDAAADTRSTA